MYLYVCLSVCPYSPHSFLDRLTSNRYHNFQFSPRLPTQSRIFDTTVWRGYTDWYSAIFHIFQFFYLRAFLYDGLLFALHIGQGGQKRLSDLLIYGYRLHDKTGFTLKVLKTLKRFKTFWNCYFKKVSITLCNAYNTI